MPYNDDTDKSNNTELNENSNLSNNFKNTKKSTQQ